MVFYIEVMDGELNVVFRGCVDVLDVFFVGGIGVGVFRVVEGVCGFREFFIIICGNSRV